MSDNTALDQANATVQAAQKQSVKDAGAALNAFVAALATAYDELGSNPVSSAARDFISSLRGNATGMAMNLANMMSQYGMNADGTDIAPVDNGPTA